MNSAAALHLGDLMLPDSEPRIKDVRLGERLGMAQPLNIRGVIEKNAEELRRYGLVHAVREPIRSGKGRIQEVTAYHLNEAQALLLCMLSRTTRAADVRQEVIGVFLAYRRGDLAPQAPWAATNRQHAIVRQAMDFLDEVGSERFALTLAHLQSGQGPKRFPKFWSDFAVRRAVIGLHRQVTLGEAHAVLVEHFGPGRAPSRSGLGRFWLVLDRMHGAANTNHGGV